MVTLFVPFALTAQEATNKERRHINSKVLTVIDDYERYASMYDEDAVYYLGELFTSENAPVICDMMGAPGYQTSMPLSEYIKLLTTYSLNTTTIIRDVKKGNMQFDEGLWRIPVTFKKNLSYIDGDGYIFSVSEYHKDEFRMTMNLVYDPAKDICRIESIDGQLISDKEFPKGRFVIINEDNDQSERWQKHFSTLTLGSKQVVFDDSGKAFLPSGQPAVRDFDVKVLTDTVARGFNYDVLKFDFKTYSTRLKLRYGFAPLFAYDVTFPKHSEYYADKSMAHEVGLDVGFTFPVGKASKMGFYFGAGLSMSSLTLSLAKSLPSYEVKYSTLDDNLFQEKAKKYEITDASQTMKYTDLIVPLYFEFEHNLSRSVMLSWNVGAKGYYELGYKSDPSYSVTVNGNALSPDKFLETNTYAKISPFDVTVMANLGVDINLLDRRLYLSIMGGYEQGVQKKVYESDKNPYFVQGSIYPVISNGDTDVAMHSLISGVSFSRRAVWFSAGLKFKL